MKTLLITLLMMSTGAHAALNMKPGLWEIDMTIKSNGKTINPVEEIQKTMATLPESEKAKMRQSLGQHARIENDGDLHTCYSKAMMDKPEALGEQKGVNCTTKLVSNTPSKVVSKFECKDGTKGDSVWNIKNPESYKGVVTVTDHEGEKSTITYLGKYLKEDCEGIKPAI